jgi:ribonuclease HII
VACASIVAKVERDRMMTELHGRYPQYGFASHKGYSVPEHMEALAVYGPSPVHRLTFRQVLPRTEARC